MRSAIDNTAVALLAGGDARRFPGKLEHVIDGRPLLVRCYERVREAGWPVYICARGSFSPELERQIDAPMLIDRRPGGGPLHAFLDACASIDARRVFAIAGDQPHVDASLLRRLAESQRDGDEAVVPCHDDAIEPLAALYDRVAALREGSVLRARGEDAMRDLIGRLAARFVPCEARYFHNVNRLEDLP